MGDGRHYARAVRPRQRGRAGRGGGELGGPHKCMQHKRMSDKSPSCDSGLEFGSPFLDEELLAEDDWHRGNDLWAIDLVNANSWGAATGYLDRTIAHCVVVAETKVPGGTAQDAAEQAARNQRWSASLVPCTVTEGGGFSAGVAVAVRGHIGLSKVVQAEAVTESTGASRFGLRLVGGVCRSGFHLGCC